MIECAAVKSERQPKSIAVLKMNPQHFSALKLSITLCGLRQFDQAQITFDKFTVRENEVGKITFCQVAIPEQAILILAGFGRIRFARNIFELLISEVG